MFNLSLSYTPTITFSLTVKCPTTLKSISVSRGFGNKVYIRYPITFDGIFEWRPFRGLNSDLVLSSVMYQGHISACWAWFYTLASRVAACQSRRLIHRLQNSD